MIPPPDPRAEAAARLGGRDVRVLEPSPPAVPDPPWFADDPVAGGEVVPVARPGTESWDEVCGATSDAALAAWCAEHWLGAWRRLEPLPPSFASTRAALHSVAEHVLTPVRHAACGKIGLRWTHGGFGTPFLPGDRQLRVERGAMVVDGERHRLSTLGTAAAIAGTTPGATHGLYTASTPCEPDAPLDVDTAAAAALGEWYGFCSSVLEQVREDSAADPAAGPGRVQLWPEHFDLGLDLGNASAGRRATFGGSPDDSDHPEPYLYVTPWEHREGPFWADRAFGGASLAYAELLAAPDQRAAALAFFARAAEALS